MKKAKRKKAAAHRAAPAKKKPQRAAAIPKGYHVATPYLAVNGASQAIDFYSTVFGAREKMRMPGPDGRIGHAEIAIGDSRIMLADEYPLRHFMGPASRGGTTVHMHLYVRDADAVIERALAEGARLVRPVEEQFYGDRLGTIEDPFGHVWHVATHVRDVSKAEMRKAAEKLAAESGTA